MRRGCGTDAATEVGETRTREHARLSAERDISRAWAMSPAFLKWMKSLFSNSGCAYHSYPSLRCYRWREVLGAAGIDLSVKAETWADHQRSHQQDPCLPSTGASSFSGETEEALPRWCRPCNKRPNGMWVSSKALKMSGKEERRWQAKSGSCVYWWRRGLGSSKRVQLSHQHQHD